MYLFFVAFLKAKRLCCRSRSLGHFPLLLLLLFLLLFGFSKRENMLLLVFPLCATATATLDCAPGLLFNYFVNVYCFFFIIFLRSLCFFFFCSTSKREATAVKALGLLAYTGMALILCWLLFLLLLFFMHLFFSLLFLFLLILCSTMLRFNSICSGLFISAIFYFINLGYFGFNR